MTPQTQTTDETADPTSDLLGRARGLAVVTGGGVMTASALAWGVAGLEAAAVGAALSVVNVWALTRFAQSAVLQAAAGGPSTAIVRLTSALGAKTALFLTVVWLIGKNAHLQLLPFTLGLLVSVFCLLGAGLVTALRAE